MYLLPLNKGRGIITSSYNHSQDREVFPSSGMADESNTADTGTWCWNNLQYGACAIVHEDNDSLCSPYFGWWWPYV